MRVDGMHNAPVLAMRLGPIPGFGMRDATMCSSVGAARCDGCYSFRYWFCLETLRARGERLRGRVEWFAGGVRLGETGFRRRAG